MRAVLERLGYQPQFCVWELTLRCDLRCRHCGSFAGQGRPDELSGEELLDVAAQLVAAGTRKVTLSGGEPTLRREWPEVARALVDGGVEVNIITNGWSWTPEHTRKAKEAGLVNVGFSVDGHEAAHDAIRARVGSYAHVMAAIDDCRAQGLPTSVVSHVNRLNFDELEVFRETLAQHGVGAWQIQIGTPTGNLAKHRELVIEPQDLLTLVPRIAALRALPGRPRISVADDVGYYGIYEQALRDRGGMISFWIGCRAGCQVVGIESNGNVKGCLSLPSERQGLDTFVEGNLRKHKLKTIWEREDAFAYNRAFEVEQLQGFCARCRFRDVCRGGCSCAAFSFSGNRFDNPLCFYRVAVENQRWDLIPDAEVDLRQLQSPSTPPGGDDPCVDSCPAARPSTGRSVTDEPSRAPSPPRSAVQASQLEAVQASFAKHDLTSARRLLSEVLTDDPRCLRALDWLGLVQFQQGLPAEAEASCRRALELAPAHPYALKGLGLCLAAQGRVEEGVASIELAIRHAPQWFDPRWDLIVTLMAADALDRAEQTLARAELELPSQRPAWARLRQLLGKRRVLKAEQAHTTGDVAAT